MKTYSKQRAVLLGIIAILAVIYVVVGYSGPEKQAAEETASAQAVVEAFGLRLQYVPRSGDLSAARTAIETQYTEFVTADLLSQWLANPKTAPGRLSSGPEPVRIAVASAVVQGSGRIVTGEVVMMTRADSRGGITDTIPFVAQVIPTENGWKIAAYQEEKVQTLKNIPKTDEDIPGAR